MLLSVVSVASVRPLNGMDGRAESERGDAIVTKRAAKRTGERATKSKTTLKFLQKPACATCKKARHFLEKRGYKLKYRDIMKDPLSAAELAKLISTHDHEDFLRPRSALFQRKKM